MKIKTKDIWCSAFVLAKGGELDAVRLEPNGSKKREALFVLAGPDITELTQEYRTGQAICNVSRLRASMIHLKEQMFNTIRY